MFFICDGFNEKLKNFVKMNEEMMNLKNHVLHYDTFFYLYEIYILLIIIFIIKQTPQIQK